MLTGYIKFLVNKDTVKGFDEEELSRNAVLDKWLSSSITTGNDTEVHYNVLGVDNVGSINLTLTNAIYETMQFLDPDNENLAYSDKKISIKNSGLDVHSEENPLTGKKYKPNLEFLMRLGMLVRHIKLNCKNTTSVFKLDSGQFEARVQESYTVDVGGHKANVTLAYGSIIELQFEGFGFKIHLYDKDIKGYNSFYMPAKKGTNVQTKFKKEYMKTFFGIDESQKKSNILDFDNINEESAFYENMDEIIAAHPDKDFSWLYDMDYKIVTQDTLDETVQYLSQFKELSMDTETTGLKITFKSRSGEHDECVGVVLTGKEGESFYFPMKHTKIDNLCDGDDYYFMEHYMKPLMEERDIIVHNATFDWKVMFIYEIVTNVIFDTQVAIQLTLKAKHNMNYGLKDVTSYLLKRDSLELDDLCRNGDFSSIDATFADLPYELTRLYACPDADNTLGIYRYIKKTKLLEEYNATKVTQFESAFACVIAYHEFFGQHIDVDKTDDLVADVIKNMETAKAKLDAELLKVGYDVSNYKPGSAKQNKEIMYDILGCPVQHTPDGRVTTGKPARKFLSKILDSNGEPKYPFVIALQEWNEADTLRKNFTKNLPDLFTPDGFSFAGVDQFKTTGRVSTKNPNYQGYNDAVKKYIEPRPGFYMTDLDYSSIEYRVIASMSGQEWLIEAFKDPNTDYHKLQASNMFEIPYELVTPQKRGEAKAFNFGLPFGMGDAKLGFTLFGQQTAENTQRAQRYRRMYFKGQEKVEKFFLDAQNDAVRYGFTETFFHRRRYYNKETTSAGSIKRQGGNQRIQGTAADIYKQACVRLFYRIINEGLIGRVLFSGFIHDELLNEVSKDVHPLTWMKIVKEECEMEIEGFCPIYIGLGFGRSWYEAKKVEIPTELQFQLQGNVDEYPDWDGDMDRFSKWIPKRISQYEREYVNEFITKEENQGQVISSVAYDLLVNQTEELQDEYLDMYVRSYLPTRTTMDIVTKSVFYKKTNKLLDKGVEDNLKNRVIAYLKKNGFDSEMELPFEDNNDEKLIDYGKLDSLLDFYCKSMSINRDSVHLLSASDVDVDKESVKQSMESENKGYDSFYESSTDEERAKEIFVSKIAEYGLHLNVDEGIVYFRFDSQLMDVVQKYVNRDEEGYRVAFYDAKNDSKKTTKAFITSKQLRMAQKNMIMVGV